MKLTRRDVLVVALSAAFAGGAWAHGPSRQKVELTVDIAAPADKVWARVANFHDMSWHPAVARTEVQGGNEVGANRVLVLKGAGDPTIAEQLTRYNAEGMTYSYKITEVDVKVLPVSNYTSHLTVTADGECFAADTRELRTVLDGVPLSEPAVALWLREYLAENTEQLLQKENAV